MIVNPLMSEPLSNDQMAVLKAVHGEFESAGRWPIWQFVQRTVRPLGSAEAALRSLPQVRDSRPAVGFRYGLVWFDNFGLGVPQADKPIHLTIAGLHRLGMSDAVLGLFLKSLRYMVEQESLLQPSPTEVVQCVVVSDELQQALFPNRLTEQDRFRFAQLKLAIEKEPPLWSGMVTQPDGKWSLLIPADIGLFEGVDTADEYIQRVCNDIAPNPAPFGRSIPSPLSVPMAVSFLDAVWTARVGQPLFHNGDPERAARLVEPVGTADEFDSCTSALADVLARIVVPADDGIQRRNRRPIAVMDDWLTKRLPERSADRVHEAVDVLIKIVNIRVGAQHTNTRHKAVQAFEVFGLAFPPSDWGLLWDSLRAAAVGALEAIREEVQANIVEPATTAKR